MVCSYPFLHLAQLVMHQWGNNAGVSCTQRSLSKFVEEILLAVYLPFQRRCDLFLTKQERVALWTIALCCSVVSFYS